MPGMIAIRTQILPFAHLSSRFVLRGEPRGEQERMPEYRTPTSTGAGTVVFIHGQKEEYSVPKTTV